MFHRCRVFAELAQHAAVLREQHDAAGAGLQRRQADQLREVAAQRAFVAAVLRAAVFGCQQLGHAARAPGVAQRRTVHAGRLVQQERDRAQGRQVGVGRQLYRLRVAHALLRHIDHHAVDANVAGLDVMLGLAARAVDLRGQAFGQALAVRVIRVVGVQSLGHAGDGTRKTGLSRAGWGSLPRRIRARRAGRYCAARPRRRAAARAGSCPRWSWAVR